MTDTALLQLQRWRGAMPMYLAASLVASMLLMPMLVHGEFISSRLLFVLLICLVLWRAASVVLLIAIQAYLGFTEPAERASAFQATEVAIVCLTLFVFVVADRYHMGRRLASELRESVDTPDASSAGPRTMREHPLHWHGAARGWAGEAAAPLLLAAGIAAAVWVSWAMLVGVPEDRAAGIQLRLRASELRAIVLGFILFAAFFAASSIASVFAWRQWSPHQARIYLRSTLVQWLDGDLRLVARRRGRRRRKAVREAKGQ